MTKFSSHIRNKWRGLRQVLHFNNWLELIFGLTIFRRTRIKIYRIRGFQFLCDHEHGDENSIRAAVATPMYQGLLANLPSDRPLTVLDFGANAGGFIALLLARGHCLRQVWAAEMNPATCQRLAFNLSHNLGVAGKAYNVAMADRDTSFEVRLGQGSTSDSLHRVVVEGDLVTVRGMSFDSFWREHVRQESVDICKIDIEGSEFEMLADGAASFLARCRLCIIEIHPCAGRNRGEIAACFERLGFVREAEVEQDGGDTVIWSWRNLRLNDLIK